MEVPGLGQVFLLALLTAVATGIGALPFLFVKDLTRSWLGVANALASGLMLAASFGLVYEGVTYGLWRTLVGVVFGLGFIVLTRKILQLRIVPDALEETSSNAVAVVVTLSIAAMVAFQFLIR